MSSYYDETYYKPSSRSSSGDDFFKPSGRSSDASSSSKSSSDSSSKSSKGETKRAADIKQPKTLKIERPKGRINLIFVFDSSSSMGIYRQNVREKAIYLVEELKKVFPDLAGNMEIAVVGVSDHCDGNLCLQATGFSSDPFQVKTNIESIKDAFGGDIPEAYECLFEMLNGWDINRANVVVVLVADSIAHGMGGANIEDNGCQKKVDWKKEISELKKKILGFYLVSCAKSEAMKKKQMPMVDDDEHFIELGGNFRRLTNVVHGIIAKELNNLPDYLSHLKTTRGEDRVEEVETLLKTKKTS